MKNHPLASLGILVVVLMALALAAPASADGKGNILRVGPNQDYGTIQAAVDAAQQGSRILVYPRIDETIEEYIESVTITTNNLQIIAQDEDGDVTVIPPKEREPGFDVNADHVTVRGFEISGAVDAPGIAFQGSHNTFAENTIHFPVTHFQGAPAIECDDEDGGSDYNTIKNNKMSPWGGTGQPDLDPRHQMSYGIVIIAPDWAMNKGNVIKNNQINEVHMGGISVVNGTGFQISGNIIEKINQGSGISIRASNNADQGHHRILENTIIGCAQSGILLYALNGTVLAHNHISDNKIREVMQDVITLKADSGAALVYNLVISNTIVDGENGIQLFADQGAAVNGNLIRDNIVSGNGVDGILLSEGSDHNRILKNDVVANVEFGVYVYGDNNLIVGNWIHDNGELPTKDEGEGNRWRNNTVSDN